MREIVFRGKTLENKEWVYGYVKRTFAFEQYKTYIENPFNELASCQPIFEVDEKTVGEYTGVKDECGVMIFEGDIIKIGNSVFEVRWNGDDAMFYIYEHVLLLEFRFDEILGKIKVIGNIHDNPKILEQ